MKIKVLTFFNNANLGSELQAYAMKEYLNSVGYSDVIFIKRGYKGKLRKGLALFERKIKNIFLSKDIKALSFVKDEYSQRHVAISAQTKKKITEFSCINLRSEYCSSASMKREKDCIFLCGSDQIWSPLIYPLVKENFLAPVSKTRKIAYAPSFGVNQLPSSFSRAVSRFVRDFDCIAMREEGAAKTVSEICGREIETVVDPVFLIPEERWHVLSDRSEIELSEPYVFCYFLDEPDEKTKKNIRNIVGDIKIVYICYKQYFEDFENSCFLDVDPADFLRLIKNSKLVITDSFHATAFSIIFEKKMRIYSRNQPKELHQDGRIRSLLKRLGISVEIDSFNGERYETDYSIVKQKLFGLSEKSREFLLHSLQKKEKSGGCDVS